MNLLVANWKSASAQAAGRASSDSLESDEAQRPLELDGLAADSDHPLHGIDFQIRLLELRVDGAIHDVMDGATLLTSDHPVGRPAQVDVWGVPFARITVDDVLMQVDNLIARRQPSFFITANVNYAMLSARNSELREVNRQAAFIVADGMPIVWWSSVLRRPLPERLAGSELIYVLCKWASFKQHRVFFLGGAPGVAQAAADALAERYPGLCVAGVASPPFRDLSEDEHRDLVQQIRDAQPDIVFAALGQPKGELWLARHKDELGVPVSVQVGATFDFVAGAIQRAPAWMQRSGLEWLYRMSREPLRLAPRYASNGLFLFGAVARDLLHMLMGCRASEA